MTGSNGNWTRRAFLNMVGVAGGAAAVYEMMTTMGLLNVPAWAADGPLELPDCVGNGQKVLILGSGVGGLTCALELGRRGFDCTILEASPRVGGRNQTARGPEGDGKVHPNSLPCSVDQVNIQPPLGAPPVPDFKQTCGFGKNLYLNLGPGRIPYHHRRLLNYCKQLGVELEVYIMNTGANLFYDKSANKAYRQRQLINDTQGYIAELLTKAVDKNALDEELAAAGVANQTGDLKDLLEVFGSLPEGQRAPDGSIPTGVPCGSYQGSTRSGCDPSIAIDQDCNAPAKLSLKQLLDSNFWSVGDPDGSRESTCTDRIHGAASLYQPTDLEWEPTLFQPKGGMDNVVQGFLNQIHCNIRRSREVIAIELVDVPGGGVRVTHRDADAPDSTEVSEAAFCISNIPLPNLTTILQNTENHHFSSEFIEAASSVVFDPACKVGWQANRRFWEEDQRDAQGDIMYGSRIFGGISYLDDLITQMWYPSEDYFSASGTLTGAYVYGSDAIRLGQMGRQARLDMARAGGMKIHPEFEDPHGVVPDSLGVSIAWQHVPFMPGGWPHWEPDETSTRHYKRLLHPDGNFFVVGDQVSPLPAWMEGAIMSAHHVLRQVCDRTHTVDPARAPDSRRLAQGRT